MQNFGTFQSKVQGDRLYFERTVGALKQDFYDLQAVDAARVRLGLERENFNREIYFITDENNRVVYVSDDISTFTVAGTFWGTDALQVPGEVSENPALFVFDGQNFSPYVEPIEERREKKFLLRGAFCAAMREATLLTKEEAKLAARGEWPSAFEDALPNLPPDLIDDAEIIWAAATLVYRNDPLLIALASVRNIPDQVLDQAFGLI